MPKKPKTQEIVRAFLAASILHNGQLLEVQSDLMFHENEQAFYYYNETSGAWRIIPIGDRDTGTQAKLLANFLETNFPDVDVNTAAIKELRSGIVRIIQNTFSDDQFDDHPYTAFKDGLFDWSTFTLLPHDKTKIAFHSFDFAYPHDAQVIPTPVFDAYIQRVFRDDPQMQTFIPEMFGYYLLPKTREPAAFYIYGPARSGKSVMLDLIRLFIGDQFACSFSLQSLTSDKYTVAELAGKRINIQDEDESEFILSDKFKALISQNKMQAERKYGAPFTFRPRCKLLFGSNLLPKFNSADDGLMRRLRFIEFKNPLEVHEQDKNILEKLRKELPGIMQKAIIAAKAFIERKEEFALPEASNLTAREFLLETDSALAFVDEMITLCPNASLDEIPSEGWTSSSEIYKAYEEWCKANGRKAKRNSHFGTDTKKIKGFMFGRSAETRYRSGIIKNAPKKVYPTSF